RPKPANARWTWKCRNEPGAAPARSRASAPLERHKRNSEKPASLYKTGDACAVSGFELRVSSYGRKESRFDQPPWTWGRSGLLPEVCGFRFVLLEGHELVHARAADLRCFAVVE